MKEAVLGIDTSCYTTSVAAADLQGEVLASCRCLLSVPSGARGLRQSEAVFLHVKQLPGLMEELVEKLHGCRIAGVCASSRPREADDSYMPVFQVGDAYARGIAAALGVPSFSSDHQRGHLEAALTGTAIAPGETLALHLSGGTTELLLYDGTHVSMLGGTLDLHAGQVVDRVGVALGLAFPAGPYLETLARGGRAGALLPVSMAYGDLHCHLSGAETQAQRWISAGTMPHEDIAREVYDLLARTAARLLLAGKRETGVSQALIVGGVASSQLFRELLSQRVAQRDLRFTLCFGKPEYSGDNAAGIAKIGAKLL